MLSIAAFTLGLWTVLHVAEPPLHALVAPEERVLDRVNVVRRQHHLEALHSSPALTHVAKLHAEDMARHGFLDHVNREGLSPLDRVRAAGIGGFRLLAENIGASDASANRVPAIIEAWLQSPVHRGNLLNPAFNTTGVGVAHAPDGRTLIVQLYATFPR